MVYPASGAYTRATYMQSNAGHYEAIAGSDFLPAFDQYSVATAG
jgi:hypothetical protein